MHRIVGLSLLSIALACSSSSESTESIEMDSSSSDASADSSGEAPDVFAEHAACDETDFAPTPFLGPGFDPETGEALAPLEPPYVVAATVGWVTGVPEDGEALGMHSGLVSEDIFNHDGLIGVAFGGSEVCGSARTLSIWEDEASMWAFVFGEIHGEAMSLVPDRVAAWGTTHWTEMESDAPPSFDDAHQRIVAEHG